MFNILLQINFMVLIFFLLFGYSVDVCGMPGKEELLSDALESSVMRKRKADDVSSDAKVARIDHRARMQSDNERLESTYSLIAFGDQLHDRFYQHLQQRNEEMKCFVGVLTTGIVCRLGCRARLPLQTNVLFSRRLYDLVSAGFRECKLCNPLSHRVNSETTQYFHILEQDYFPDKETKEINAQTKQAFIDVHNAELERYVRVKRVNHILRNNHLESTTKYPNTLFYQRFWTPIGVMIACFSHQGLCLLEFADRKMLEAELLSRQKKFKAHFRYGSIYGGILQQELEEYFQGKRLVFTTPIDWQGSKFQIAAWNALMKINYGETSTYALQAQSIDQPNAVRAIASANGQNAISLLVPCHRVVGTNGELLGYGGGIERKQFLLNLEKLAQLGTNFSARVFLLNPREERRRASVSPITNYFKTQ